MQLHSSRGNLTFSLGNSIQAEENLTFSLGKSILAEEIFQLFAIPLFGLRKEGRKEEEGLLVVLVICYPILGKGGISHLFHIVSKRYIVS